MAGGNTRHRGLACHIAPLSRSDGKQCQSKSGVWIGCSSFLLQMSSLLLFTTHYLWTCPVWEIMKGQVQSQKIPHLGILFIFLVALRGSRLLDLAQPARQEMPFNRSFARGWPHTLYNDSSKAKCWKKLMTFPLRQRHVLAKAKDGSQNFSSPFIKDMSRFFGSIYRHQTIWL